MKIVLPDKQKKADIAEIAIYTDVQCCKTNFDGDHKTSLLLMMPIYPDVVFLILGNPFYTMSTFPLSLHFHRTTLSMINFIHISHQLMSKCKYFVFPAILDDSVHRKRVFMNIDCCMHTHFI